MKKFIFMMMALMAGFFFMLVAMFFRHDQCNVL